MRVTLAQYNLLTPAEQALVTHINASIADASDEDREALRLWREQQVFPDEVQAEYGR